MLFIGDLIGWSEFTLTTDRTAWNFNQKMTNDTRAHYDKRKSIGLR